MLSFLSRSFIRTALESFQFCIRRKDLRPLKVFYLIRVDFSSEKKKLNIKAPQ